MPYQPLRHCAYPGCPSLVRDGKCTTHRSLAQHGWENQAGTNTQRIRGRELQRRRTLLFAREPVCRQCHRAPSAIRDHIVPLAEGGSDEETNIQPLCHDCSIAKTAREAQRGRHRVGIMSRASDRA